MPDESTHEIAVRTSGRPEAEAERQPRAEVGPEGRSKPSASERLASEAAPVQIKPDGR